MTNSIRAVCVYHSVDLDGWMSAAIVKHWWESQVIPTGMSINRSLTFIGYNYGQPIPNLSEYDKVIMCDVSFPEEEMYKLCVTKDFIWNDHHASALAMYENIRPSLPNDIYYAKGLRGVHHAACELTWKYFFPNKSMPEIVRLLGRYDCFGHKGTHEEQKVLEFQYGARQVISDYQSAYYWLTREINESIDCIPEQKVEVLLWDKGESIYQYLCTEAKQVYKNGFIIKFWIDDEVEPLRFICVNKERFNPINFNIDYHKDGYDGAACFHYANGKWCFSLYNDNGLADCSQIAKQFGGGGHKGASGFMIEDISQFINKPKFNE